MIQYLKETNFKALLFDFEGRISRKEYWTGILVVIAFGVTVGVMGNWLDKGMFQTMFLRILQVVILVPSLALQIKRWHDRNKSAWWCLINLVPIIGGIWSFIELGFLPSVNEENEY